MGFALFTQSGTFKPSDYGLSASDMIHIKCVGGGGGGSAFNSTAGTAGSASSFGSIISAEGGYGGTTGANTQAANQVGGNRGSIGCYFSLYGKTWYSCGTGGDGWLPGYSGGSGIPAILLLPHTISSLSYSSSSSSLNFSDAYPTNAGFFMFNRPFAVSTDSVEVPTTTTYSANPYSYPGYVYGYYSSSYYNIVSAGGVGYGAGGGSGGSRPNRCNYGSGGNSGVIKDINYKIANDNAIAVTVGTGGAGGSTYGGGGANGCVAIWW